MLFRSVVEDEALENEFSCKECTEIYTLVDNTTIVKELKGKITKKENEVKNIKEELKNVLLKKHKSKELDKKKKKKCKRKVRHVRPKKKKKVKIKKKKKIKHKKKHK